MLLDNANMEQLAFIALINSTHLFLVLQVKYFCVKNFSSFGAKHNVNHSTKLTLPNHNNVHVILAYCSACM